MHSSADIQKVIIVQSVHRMWVPESQILRKFIVWNVLCTVQEAILNKLKQSCIL